MKRLVYAWLTCIILSYLYGRLAYQYPNGVEFFGYTFNFLVIFFAPMVIFDSLLIWYLGKKRVPGVTGKLTFVLSISIAVHTVGATCWATYNQLGAYDASRYIIFALEVLAITGGRINQYINGRRRQRPYNCHPGVVVMSEIEE